MVLARFIIFAFLISFGIACLAMGVYWFVQHKIRLQEERLHKWQKDQELKTDRQILRMYLGKDKAEKAYNEVKDKPNKVYKNLMKK